MKKTDLIKLGFKRKIWYDRNSVNDAKYTLKFIEYKKNITDDVFIVITYDYVFNIDKYILLEITKELEVDTVFVEINLESKEDIINFEKYFK